MVDPRDDRIELVEPRPDAWRTAFERERERVRDVLAASDLAETVERIEHVGSTAVPGVAAKPVVDLDVVVADDAVERVSAAVAESGGTRYRNHDGWHPVFREVDGRRFNDHVFARSDAGWKISVVTRDVLEAHPDLRDEYERRKRHLAAATDDLERYSAGKTETVDRLLAAARSDPDLQFPFEVPETAQAGE